MYLKITVKLCTIMTWSNTSAVTNCKRAIIRTDTPGKLWCTTSVSTPKIAWIVTTTIANATKATTIITITR